MPDASDKLNDMIDTAINELADDNIARGGEALQELAQLFAKAGTGIESFQNTRKYIIQEAEKRTSAAFMREKLVVIEREMKRGRQINNLQCH